MQRKRLPDLETLHSLLEYDPYSGNLFWRNTGGIAEVKGRNGYARLNIGGVQYAAHRVAFKIMTNQEPEVIDHINGNRADNSWSNIRGVSVAENNRNRCTQRNNTTGFTGVHQERNGRFKAHICVNKKDITIGRYDTLFDAVKARKAAELFYDFHPNHGRCS